MSQPILAPNGRPVASQQMQAQAQAQQMYFGVFFSLVPVVAAEELRQIYENGGEINTEYIMAVAKKIAVAAMKEIGVNIE